MSCFSLESLVAGFILTLYTLSRPTDTSGFISSSTFLTRKRRKSPHLTNPLLSSTGIESIRIKQWGHANVRKGQAKVTADAV